VLCRVGQVPAPPKRQDEMFSLIVAWRYLISNTSQSALLIAGVALGVTAYVFITALVQGLAIRLTDDVTANSAHISLEPPIRFARILTAPGMKTEAVSLVSTLQRKQIRNWRSTLELVRQQPKSPQSVLRSVGTPFCSGARLSRRLL
jgi:lipoprotein-releasing system permease protein